MKKTRFFGIFLSLILFFSIFHTVTVQGATYSNVYNGVDYSAVFDYENYYNRYPDLQRAFGKDYSALLKHFVLAGMNEGRQANDYFDVNYYKNAYPDLRNAYGNDLRKYYIHYIYAGKNEGRLSCSYTYYNGVDYSDVFDYDCYYKIYPDLQKALGYNPKALLEHFVLAGMNEGRIAKDDFNVMYYKNTYPDLQNAYGNDMRRYYYHYMYAGKYEGRLPCTYTSYDGVDYSDVFNYDDYYRLNPDVRNALGYNPKALLTHFVLAGMNEGRIAKNDFDVKYYKNTYPDLQNAFGNDMRRYYYHYMYAGKYENRCTISDSSYNGVDYSKIYDKDYYYNTYPDLRNALGNDSRALIKHFVLAGMYEGRQASPSFDVNYYKNRYPDLRNAFGDNLQSYYMHYLYGGYYEGRIAAEKMSGWINTNNGKMYFENGVPATGWRLLDGRQYYFNDMGILKSKTGIDVSKFNGDINWQQVKDDGIEFAIIRIGYGSDYVSQDDEKAIYNMEQCEALGIPYGVYLYSYALTEANVDSEVAHTLRMISGRNPSLGVFFDMEDADGYKANHGMPSKDMLNNFCIRYMRGISNAGYKAGVYASKYWFTNTLTSSTLDEYIKWVAQWATTNTYNGKYTMWQYTSSGSVNGITGRVDMNVYLEN